MYNEYEKHGFELWDNDIFHGMEYCKKHQLPKEYLKFPKYKTTIRYCPDCYIGKRINYIGVFKNNWIFITFGIFVLFFYIVIIIATLLYGIDTFGVRGQI